MPPTAVPPRIGVEVAADVVVVEVHLRSGMLVAMFPHPLVLRAPTTVVAACPNLLVLQAPRAVDVVEENNPHRHPRSVLATLVVRLQQRRYALLLREELIHLLWAALGSKPMTVILDGP